MLVGLLAERHMTVTAAESCTGGLVAAAITSVPGSSAVLKRSYVTYCDDAKHDLVGVRRHTLRKYTAVSAQAAAEMARGGAKRAHADCAVSVTGYAGPPAGNEPVGLVYIGCHVNGRTYVKKWEFEGNRAAVRIQARDMALASLLVLLRH